MNWLFARGIRSLFAPFGSFVSHALPYPVDRVRLGDALAYGVGGLAKMGCTNSRSIAIIVACADKMLQLGMSQDMITSAPARYWRDP